MKPELAERESGAAPAACAHQWVDLGADATHCWRRQCRLCGAFEGQEHTLVYGYTVVGCCSHPYVCEGCGYIPQ
ncbi:MAG TPA: hypothetical protein PKH77_02730 [Anaerolineae bacterium]|nr:hypothetical protein [Anaerolineae bacterium]